MICTRHPSRLIVLRVDLRKTVFRRLASRPVVTRGSQAMSQPKLETSRRGLLKFPKMQRVHTSKTCPRRRFSEIAPV